MTSVALDAATLAGIAANYPRRDIPAIYARFVKWAEKTTVYAPDRAFRSWVENAERDDSNRLDAGGRPATEEFPAFLGERSDPTYAAFRMGLIQRILAEKLSPAATADILAEHHDKFTELPGVCDALDAEIARYRLAGQLMA